MALVKANLEASILAAFDKQAAKTDDPAKSRKELASDLADAVFVFIKSGVVNTQVVTNTGTGTGVGSII